MKSYTYSEARQNLSQLLNIAQREEVEIRRRDGTIFSVRPRKQIAKSPFDVAGIKTKATTKDILAADSESRTDY
jgi:antitoxin (DNA-binding transcriptional repressor) of toxin-antitoxin stability system